MRTQIYKVISLALIASAFIGAPALAASSKSLIPQIKQANANLIKKDCNESGCTAWSVQCSAHGRVDCFDQEVFPGDRLCESAITWTIVGTKFVHDARYASPGCYLATP